MHPEGRECPHGLMSNAMSTCLKPSASIGAWLALLHRWDYEIPGMVDAAMALADLQSKGLIKNVGLTNMVSPTSLYFLNDAVEHNCSVESFQVPDHDEMYGHGQSFLPLHLCHHTLSFHVFRMSRLFLKYVMPALQLLATRFVMNEDGLSRDRMASSPSTI